MIEYKYVGPDQERVKIRNFFKSIDPPNMRLYRDIFKLYDEGEYECECECVVHASSQN